MKSINELYADYDRYCQGKRQDRASPLSLQDFLWMEATIPTHPAPVLRGGADDAATRKNRLEFREGVKANEHGEQRAACPYRLGTAMYRNTERECRDWLSGWDAQQIISTGGKPTIMTVASAKTDTQ